MTYLLSLLVLAYLLSRFWVFACISSRDYNRNYVYNYVLQNNKENWLKRLWERNPIETQNGWVLLRADNVDHGSQMSRDGFIQYRKTNTVQFYLIVFIAWMWLDDDSNYDTTDKGLIESIASGERKILPILPADIITVLFKKQLKKVDFDGVTFGNSFDLGDIRAEHPFYNFFATLVWNSRNPLMNFKYLWMDY